MMTYIFRKRFMVFLVGLTMVAVLLSSIPGAYACPPPPKKPPQSAPCVDEDPNCKTCANPGGSGPSSPPGDNSVPTGGGSDASTGSSSSNTGNGSSVNFGNGGLNVEDENDLEVPSGTQTYVAQRYYNSLIDTQALGQGSEGNKWGSYLINTRLIAEGGDITAIMSPMTARTFPLSRLSIALPGYDGELRPVGPDEYILVHHGTNRTLAFYPIDNSPLSGKLRYREDAYGNRITFSYDANGRPVLVRTPESHQVIYKWNINSTPERIRSAEVRLAGGEIVSAATYVYHGPITSDSGTLGDLSMVHRLRWVRHSGTTTSTGTTTRLNDAALVDKNTVVGDRVVIVDGANAGHIREVVNAGNDFVEWAAPLPYNVDASVSYFLVKNTGRISTVHYRYYNPEDADGTASQLKAIYENGAVQALVSKAGWTSAGDLLSKADNTKVDGKALKSYASSAFTYYTKNLPTNNVTMVGGWSQNGTPWGGSLDTNLDALYDGTNCNKVGFVKSATVRDSCSSCSGSAEGVTYYFYYMDKNEGDNAYETYRITVEDTMYGGQRVQRKVMALNKDGSLLREAVVDNPDTPRYWCASYILDGNTSSRSYAKLLEFRMPSAHTVVNSAAALRNFLDPTTGMNDANTVNVSSGLVYVYGYNGDGHLIAVRAKNGAGVSVPAYYVFAAEYGSDSVAGESSNFPKITYTYPTQQVVATNGKATTYSYTFYGTDKRAIQKTTVTGPIISETENGDNTGIVTMTYRDAKGRLRWFRDGEGRIAYYSPHPPTGGLAYVVEDVKTDSNAGGLPAEIVNGSPGLWDPWGSTTAPAGFQQTGDALGLVTKTEFDALGRSVKSTDPMGTITYRVYRDNVNEVRTYPAWDTVNSKPRLPVQVTQRNAGDRIVLRYAFDASSIVFPSRPDGSETVPVSLYTSRITWNYDAMGRLVSVDRYVDADPANKLTTQYGYDAWGRQSTVTDPDGTMAETRYDTRNRPIEIWVGSGSQLAKITSAEYDNNGVGDGHVTTIKSWLDDSAAYATTYVRYDYRGLRDRTLGPDNVLTVVEHNWAGATTAVTQYASVTNINASPTMAISKSAIDYDARGLAFRRMQYNVANGSVTTDKLTTYFWYNKNGQQIKSRDPNGLFQKTQYDGVGRQIASYLSYQDNEPVATAGTYTAATNVIGDVVIEQSKTVYDAADNVIIAKTFRRKDATPLSNTGELVLTSDPTDPTATVQIVAYWYEDGAYWPRKTANYGDNGNVDMVSRPHPEPALGTANVLVTTLERAYFNYDANNQAWPLVKATDNDGKTTWSIRDILGRTYKTIENYDDGQVNNSDNDVDRTTIYGYDAKGRMTTITAKNPKGTHVEDQVTTYVYDPQAFLVSPASYRQDKIWAVIYPNSTATYNPNAAPGSRIAGPDHVRYTYNRQGRRTTARDQRGVEHTYTFDSADRLQADKITAWDNSGNVDQTVKAITYTYDAQGRLAKFTSHGNATDNPADITNVKNQTVHAYDDGVGNLGWGSLKASWQSHAGTATTSGIGESPKVSYVYANGTVSNQARFVRLASFTYPNGNQLHYNYGVVGSIGDRLSRPEAITDGFTNIVEYAYNGVSQMVKKAYPTPQMRLTPGFDRFSRVTAQTWQNISNPAVPVAVQDIRHAYDVTSRRIYADNKVYETASQYYQYDGLSRLVNFKAGELARDNNQIPIGVDPGDIQREQGWILESLGNTTNLMDHEVANWRQSTFTKTNEIATQQVDGQAPVNFQYDAAGNLTYDGKQKYTYDAWNRQVEVKRDNAVISTSFYDGLHRRIKKAITNCDDLDYTYLYYYDGRQLIEERSGSDQTLKTYVWGEQYIDELVQINTHIGTIGSFWTMQDANYNVLSVIDSTGSLVERYEYTPYGERTTYATRASLDDPPSVNDPLLLTPQETPVRLSGTIPVALCDIGHQGLMHDQATQLIYNRLRMYSPDQQVFMQPDPKRYVDGMNYYQYVSRNPVLYRDPMGLFGKEGHTDITKKAFGLTGLKFQTPGKLTKDYLEVLVNTNNDTDVLRLLESSYHAQNIDFGQIIADRMKKIKERKCSKTDNWISGDWLTLNDIGTVLHILQDIYAHTDWVEGTNMNDVYEANKSKLKGTNDPNSDGHITLDNLEKWADGIIAKDEKAQGENEAAFKAEFADVLFYTGGLNLLANDAHKLFAADDDKSGRSREKDKKGKTVGLGPKAYGDAVDAATEASKLFILWAKDNMTKCCCEILFGKGNCDSNNN